MAMTHMGSREAFATPLLKNVGKAKATCRLSVQHVVRRVAEFRPRPSMTSLSCSCILLPSSVFGPSCYYSRVARGAPRAGGRLTRPLPRSSSSA